ncbi:putative serine/threonine-protein kinase iks1 [Blastocladiella emersonii ATCC 22665]|nr:putative serine/threonine-protein kinase iks1 [Blastocladiella emersonii ATCC 22665]
MNIPLPESPTSPGFSDADADAGDAPSRTRTLSGSTTAVAMAVPIFHHLNSDGGGGNGVAAAPALRLIAGPPTLAPAAAGHTAPLPLLLGPVHSESPSNVEDESEPMCNGDDAMDVDPAALDGDCESPETWQIILHNENTRQLVLYNPANHALVLQSVTHPSAAPSTTESHPRPRTRALSHASSSSARPRLPVQLPPECPLCGRAFETGQFPNMTTAAAAAAAAAAAVSRVMHHHHRHADADADANGHGHEVVVATEPTFLDQDYFRLLENVHAAYPLDTDADPRSSSPLPAPTDEPSQGVKHASFNQGYYDRFFVELKKLGRGAHGSVFLCQHVLDDIPLGEYAIKKVAVGDNHPWLSRMLREVTLLERLRHPNIVAYKHAWLEHCRHTPFGPDVPSLFILMERANGGNLEEFLQPDANEDPTAADGTGTVTKAKLLRARRRAARLAALPSLPAAWSTVGRDGGWAVTPAGSVVRLLATRALLTMVLGVARGLAHLHRHGIVHRDLKPPNILLAWESESDSGDAGPPNDADEPSASSPPTSRVPTVLISDFGECEVLAPSDDPAARRRRRSGNTGTIDFTAPELLDFDRAAGAFTAAYSPKADIWSLGLVALYTAYAGHLPFRDRDDIDALRAEILALDAARVFPTEEEERVPRAFRSLVARCLARDPADRPTAAQVCGAIEKMLADATGGGDAVPAPAAAVVTTTDEEEEDEDDVIPAPAPSSPSSSSMRKQRASSSTRHHRHSPLAPHPHHHAHHPHHHLPVHHHRRTEPAAAAVRRHVKIDRRELAARLRGGGGTSPARPPPAAAAAEPAAAGTSVVRRRRVNSTPSPATATAAAAAAAARESSEHGDADEPMAVELFTSSPSTAPPPAPAESAATPAPAAASPPWYVSGTRLVQVATLAVMPGGAPLGVAVGWTCLSMAATDWALLADNEQPAGVPPPHVHRVVVVVGGLVVHALAMAGIYVQMVRGA